jgi:hypothetical protein
MLLFCVPFLYLPLYWLLHLLGGIGIIVWFVVVLVLVLGLVTLVVASKL